MKLKPGARNVGFVVVDRNGVKDVAADGDYEGWGLHVWDGTANPTEWSSPLRPPATEARGVTFRVPDPALRTASFVAATGTLTVPVRSVAVFVQV